MYIFTVLFLINPLGDYFFEAPLEGGIIREGVIIRDGGLFFGTIARGGLLVRRGLFGTGVLLG